MSKISDRYAKRGIAIYNPKSKISDTKIYDIRLRL